MAKSFEKSCAEHVIAILNLPGKQKPLLSDIFPRPDSEKKPDWIYFRIIDEKKSATECKIKLNAYLPQNLQSENSRIYLLDSSYMTYWYDLQYNERVSSIDEEPLLRFIQNHIEGLPKAIHDTLVQSGMKLSKSPLPIQVLRRRIIAAMKQHLIKRQTGILHSHKLLTFLRNPSLDIFHPPFPITTNILQDLTNTCSIDSSIDIRDKALLTFCFEAGGLKRSLVTNIQFNDFETLENDRLLFTHPVTKHAGILSRKTSHNLLRWFELIKSQSGIIFRPVNKRGDIGSSNLSDISILRIINRRCELAGYDPSDFNSHSLRTGFFLESARKSIPIETTQEIAGQSTKRSIEPYYTFVQELQKIVT